ncbi:MAG: deoxyribose-phosphate aldolase, partial [Acidimicrobiia bacterium]|nr:deoxyribose-phosphate aldolase [Acidimicrobiia bacterium]
MTVVEPYAVETITERRVAKTIDHSLLKPELTVDEVLAGCEVAARYDVASVCCRPIDVERCRDALAGTNVLVSTVIGFPHGSNLTATKVFETERAIEQGAVELDMVMQIGLLRSGMADAVRDDIAGVVAAAGNAAIVKVILENAYLTDAEKVAGCRAAEDAGAAYVKTSTGYAPTGATLDDLRLMRATVSPSVKVKAAGGVRTLDALIDCLNAGIDRCGATATAAIIDDLR